jgi:transposase IS4-like protein/DDE family transposase
VAGVIGVAERTAVRLPDRIGIGVLTSAFPPELIDLAIEEWDVREERHRMLPARVMAYYAMACAMYFDDAYGEVWNKLLGGLEWARRYRRRRQVGMQPTTAALTKARARLGWEAMAEILEAGMTPLTAGPDEAPWAYFHRLRVLGVDGFTMNVAKTPTNVAGFGVPSNGDGSGAYPQVRVVALAETGTRSLQGAQVGPLTDGEQTMARVLWPRLGSGDVVVGDRGFLSHEDLTAIVATGAHAVLRVKADIDLPVLAVLSDGSWISRIADPKASRRLRRKGVASADIPGIEVRVIEYTLAGDPDHPLGAGAESELFCLVTTLIDAERYPMEGFPDLYHDRWQIETAIGDVETRLRGGPDVVLRSKSPDMVRQEVYGLLCVYQAVRALMNAGAEHAEIDPDRVSFTRAMQAAARHLSDDAAFSP